MSQEVIIHYQSRRSAQMITLSEILDDEQYARYLKRQFPVECRGSSKNNIQIWLNDKDELHREENLPSWKSMMTGYSEYRVNGKLHRTDGPAIEDDYWFDGIKYEKAEWQKVVYAHNMKRVYFLREKIVTLQKLLEIPELYDEVYYANKPKFISLMKKI